MTKDYICRILQSDCRYYLQQRLHRVTENSFGKRSQITEIAKYITNNEKIIGEILEFYFDTSFGPEEDTKITQNLHSIAIECSNTIYENNIEELAIENVRELLKSIDNIAAAVSKDIDLSYHKFQHSPKRKAKKYLLVDEQIGELDELQCKFTMIYSGRLREHNKAGLVNDLIELEKYASWKKITLIKTKINDEEIELTSLEDTVEWVTEKATEIFTIDLNQAENVAEFLKSLNYII